MKVGNVSHTEHEEINDAYKWNLKDLSSSDQGWPSRKTGFSLIIRNDAIAYDKSYKREFLNAEKVCDPC
jgi:hypothetical protein